MALHLQDFDAAQNRFAHVAFTGHRGSGKSTELYHLEHDLGDRFFTLHLFTDETLLQDCDYTDLLLWLVDALVREFADQQMPLEAKLVERVVDWFAEKTFAESDDVKKEIELTARGINAIMELLAARMDIAKIFANPGVVRDLALASGGSMRDLMRLLSRAQLAARVDGQEQIGRQSASAQLWNLVAELRRGES